jgi:hypothetical protein
LFRRSGAPAALLVALTAVACLLPGSASAVEFRTVTESFGADGTSVTTFGFPRAVGFDQGDKRLYVVDGGEEKLHGFDSSTPATHTPLGGSFPLSVPVGELNGLAADPFSHDFFYANPSDNKLYGFSESGAALSGFPIAGQNFSCGTAVDSSGDVWVAEGNEEIIKEYSPAGALIATHAVSLSPCSLAFDAEDNLYVGYYFGSTVKYTAASGYTAATTIDPEFTSAMTVDKATGEVFVIHYNYIDVWTESGEFLYRLEGEPFGGEFAGVAVNEATEELYVSDYGNGVIDVYGPPVSLPKLTTEGADGITATGGTVHGTINPKGLAVEDCHFEVIPAEQFISAKYKNVTPAQKYPCVPAAGSIPVDSNPHTVSASVSGLSSATTYHYRLVAKNSIGEATGVDRRFTIGAAAPLIVKQSVQEVGTSEATLAATINPRGGETTYHVEYGTTNAYGQSTAESAPFGSPTDTSSHPVSVHIGGLQPGTAYHFRFVATNPVAAVEGTDTSFATYPLTTQAFATCLNDRFRTALGSRLPDCRAYEQVSPVEKHGANAQGAYGADGTNPVGDRVTFFANGGLPTTGSTSRSDAYIASRGPGGWSTDGLQPLTAPGRDASIYGVNEDLSAALMQNEGPGGIGAQLFLRDTETATFRPIGPVFVPEYGALSLTGFAADPSHVTFLNPAHLLPSAPIGKYNLYDLDHGTLTLADRIPVGAAISCDDEAGPACVVPSEGTAYGGESAKMSRDGSRVFFTANATEQSFNTGRIYLREDGVRTTWISASQRTTPDPGGEKPARLVGIARDGSKAFFLSCEKLTDDSTSHSNGEDRCAGGPTGEAKQGQDLYSYDVETGELTDLTVDSNAGDPLGANVQFVLGVSDDSSYIYFFADGVLASGASHNNCRNYEAKCNLYVYHDGVTTFIAQIYKGPNELEDRTGSLISPGGSVFIFSATESLTGYNNIGPCANGGAVSPCLEFFRYSAPDEELLCVTCKPTETPPTGSARLGTNAAGGDFKYNDTASGAPPHSLSADGNRFFFETAEALVSRDTNGVYDVYEWEAKETGSCESESQNGGCLYLISSGTDPQPSNFLDASANGDHVFFFTEQQLVPGDQDVLFDVYDAGVGAGLAAQHELTPPTCTSTACQANPAPPLEQTPASAAYSGPGNAHQRSSGRKCPKGKRNVRRKGKVSCKQAHKQHKRHHDRGGSK